MQQSSRSALASTELLKQLHWLPIECRIRFKLASSVYKILTTGHPPYLTELLQYHKPARSTRSSASHFLFRDTTFHLMVLALSASLRPKYGTPYSRRRDHITPVLCQLHWLPVRRRVEFKLACGDEVCCSILQRLDSPHDIIGHSIQKRVAIVRTANYMCVV